MAATRTVPYRIQILFNHLSARKELASCRVELLDTDTDMLDDGKYFPTMQHDPVRVLVTRGDHHVGIMGRLHQGVFHYLGSGWIGDTGIDAPTWGMVCLADIVHLSTVIEYVVSMFDQAPP